MKGGGATHTLGLTEMSTFLCVRMKMPLTLPALLSGESRMPSSACTLVAHPHAHGTHHTHR